MVAPKGSRVKSRGAECREANDLETEIWRGCQRSDTAGVWARMLVPARVYIVDRTHEILMSVLCAPRATVMSETVQRAAETAVSKRYEALFRVSQTLISIRSSEELFSILAIELRAVVNFYVMGVGIYDEKTHEMVTTSYGEPGVPLQAPKFAPEETFSWWVYQHQQPLIIPSLDAETRFPAVAEMLKNRGVCSVCVLPLTTVHRRLGGLAMGSLETDAYSREEVSFLSLVANQVALAVDDALTNDGLRASEESFRLIVDSIPGLVNTTTAAGEFEFVNQQCLDYFGVTLDELKGWATSDIVHPDDLSHLMAAWRHSVETGHPHDSEYRIRRADGVYRWFHVRSLPWRDTQGRIVRWYTLRTDIDDRRRVEEALHAAMSERTRLSTVRAEIAVALASKDNLRGILHTCAETMVRHLDAAFARIWTLNKDGRVLELQASAGMYTRLDGRYSRIPIGEIKIGLIAQERKAHLTNDVQNDPRISDSDWAKTEKMTSFAGYPLVVQDRVVGVMGMFSRKGLAQSTLDALAFIADGIAQGIQRKSAEEALRASELNLRLVVDSIPGLVCTMNAKGEVQTLNRQVLEYFGRTAEEMRGWATSDAVHPDDLPRVLAAFTSSIETGHPYDIEHRCRRADGVYRWFQVRALPVRDTERRVVSWYILLTDIDKRKQAEDRLHLLLDLTNQVVSNLQLRDLLRAISGNIRRVMQCDCASLALPNAENKELQLNVLDFPEGKGFFHEEGVYSIEGSPYGTAFRTMKPLALDKPFATWLNNPVVQSRISEGFKSLCFIPLMRRNRAIGTLNLGRLRGDAFSQEDLYFLGQVANQIAIAVENALEYGQITEAKERLAEQKLYLEDEIRREHNFEEIIGNSPMLKAVLESVRIVAPADSTVLIQGETGTGKEVIARAIHNLSSRKGHAFVKVNCAAIPLGLLESELFGHEKGSFTGAIAQRIGRFELAHKGTLFLDEVGDIPLELQPKLLRVLQEQEFERLGSTRTQRVDVRLLAATNTSLTHMVAKKQFRSDLYYRLNVFPIDVPPLRDRRDDIPLLVHYFANKYARRMGKHIESIPNETMDALSRYSWPGNIRELQNLMERAALLSTGPSLRVPLAEILTDSVFSASSGGTVLEQAEREQILRALRESNWVVGGARGAAARLGLKRTSLAYKMQKLGISRPPQ
jgi:formate hydrogenlyase transcriptional activator